MASIERQNKQADKLVSLPQLAKEIRGEWREFRGALQTSLERAASIGDLLCRAKAVCGHGKFLPWVEKNCPFSEDTAERFMKVSKEVSNSANVRNLPQSYSRLLGELSSPKDQAGANGKTEVTGDLSPEALLAMMDAAHERALDVFNRCRSREEAERVVRRMRMWADELEGYLGRFDE